MTVTGIDNKAANSIQEKTDSAELIQLVSFKLADEEFGVDILQVQEINRLVEITKVPKTPDFVEGVINLRGKVIPVVDLRKRFELEKNDSNADTRIIVVDIDNSIMGMIVDEVSEVLRLSVSTIEPAPDITTSIEADYISGVAKIDDRLLILLDLSKAFSPAEKEAINQF